MVALEWMDVEPLIGCKVSDYIIQHKRVEDPSEAEVYTGVPDDPLRFMYYCQKPVKRRDVWWENEAEVWDGE